MNDIKTENLNGGYSICLNEWALDYDIKDELGLLSIISSLTGKTGYCYASNEYLANLFNISTVTISRRLKKLEKKGYIFIEYKRSGCTITSRKIFINIDTKRNFNTTINTDDNQRLTSTLMAINTDDNGTINTDVKDKNISVKNISLNNTSLNNISTTKKPRTKKEFIPPTESEVKSYCDKMGYKVDAHEFVNWYTDPESGKWIDANGKEVKNWKQKLRQWSCHNNNNGNGGKSKSYYQSAIDKAGCDKWDGDEIPF